MLIFVLMKGVKKIIKNVKYLGFVGLLCALLLLTGCGGGSSNFGGKNILTCTEHEDNEDIELPHKFVFEFDDKGENIIGVNFYATSQIFEGTSDEELEEIKSSFEETYCYSSDRIEECKISVSGDKIEIEVSASSLGLKPFNGVTKLQAINDYESEGYICK